MGNFFSLPTFVSSLLPLVSLIFKGVSIPSLITSAVIFAIALPSSIVVAKSWKCEKNKEDIVTLFKNTFTEVQNYVLPMIYLGAMIAKIVLDILPPNPIKLIISGIILGKAFPLILFIATYTTIGSVRQINC